MDPSDRLRVGAVTSSRYLEHAAPGGGHPERPARLRAAQAGLREKGLWDRLVHLAPRPATREELLAVHDASLVREIEELSAGGGGWIDPDTYVTAASYEVARLAAGGVVTLVDALLERRVERGLALVRPPGHHATAERAMGFCLFNNVAVAARHAQRRHGLGRVLIVDWDVHHGNGTQAIFWRDGAVAFFSTHQFPFYPGTGAAAERGEGPGHGWIVNVPLRSGSGDADVLRAYDEHLAPLWERARPQLVLVSAGFDAHARDPLAGLRMSSEGYGALTRWLLDRAADVPVAFVLEGGYDELALAESIAAVARECLAPSRDTSPR